MEGAAIAGGGGVTNDRRVARECEICGICTQNATIHLGAVGLDGKDAKGSGAAGVEANSTTAARAGDILFDRATTCEAKSTGVYEDSAAINLGDILLHVQQTRY